MKERLRSLLDALKYRGRATVPELASDLDLNVETVRDHLRTLEGRELVRRDGTLQQGPGRPEIVFVLTAAAEALFPRREAEILRELAQFMVAHRQAPLLRDFFREYVSERREQGLARVEGLTGRKRVREVARIMDEMGFMPVLEDHGDTLRLCHCPMRGLVEATDLPCREEIGLLRELLDGSLTRVSHMPHGDLACAYKVDIES
ncbi:MAG: helix-turn-helix domain-containing protein [Gemmatimonadetes bacterium]|nr:helix-turn-helix domain-containing protein [Gemmatimonadota bacterium]